ncbi:hypothetical protein Tco_0931967, partial [Tanacetum coccineum]
DEEGEDVTLALANTTQKALKKADDDIKTIAKGTAFHVVPSEHESDQH